jgi:hypothetical protein
MSSDLDAQLRRSAPLTDVAVCSEAVRELVGEITSTQRRPVLGSRKRRLAAVSAAAVVFVPTAAAAAFHFATSTAGRRAATPGRQCVGAVGTRGLCPVPG